MTDTPNARLLDCGFCYEEQGEKVHPHPECPIGRPAVSSAGVVQMPPTNQATPSRRAGLRDEIAAALEAADYRMDMRRGDLADAILPVLYREWPWLRAEAEDAVVPPTDRAALRDRIAAALYERERPPRDPAWADAYAMDREVFEAMANTVLKVLPAPVDQAAIYRALADQQTQLAVADDLARRRDMAAARRQLVKELRRMAAEAPATEEQDDATPFTVQVWPLARVLTEVRCGSQDWTWEEEWTDLDRRHADTGYLDKLEHKIRTNGITMPVLVGTDGRLWDGHHRLRIAVRLGIGYVPVEFPAAAVVQPAQPHNDETPLSRAHEVFYGDKTKCVDHCPGCAPAEEADRG